MVRTFIRSAVAAAALLVGGGSAWAAVDLPALKIDSTQTTVSGLSAGGFMAVQLHVAYSATFAKGAGVVAGGPFYCAENSIINATGRCMASPAGIPTSTLISTTNSWASQGLIDPVSNLQNSKVYLFSGTKDSVVKQGVMDALNTYYKSFVPVANIVYKKDIAAEHAMVTDDYGNACATKGAPYISDCNFDLAGNILQQLYGTLNPRNNAALPAGNFIEFKQSTFITNHGMATNGWAYVPQACQAGGTATCRLHVVLHGCKQNVSDVQQQYVRNTGYNRWGDSNNIVMLYPQTSTSATNSCFDWWGYDNANYSKKSGPQMAAIKAMVDQVSSGTGGTPPVELPAPAGANASNATANSVKVNWSAVTGAAGYNVYRGATKVTAQPVTAVNFTDSGLASSTTYTWTVRAVDSAGGEGAASAPASGTTLAGPPPLAAPAGVNTSNATVSGMQVNWTAVSGAASYNVYRNANKTNALPVNALNFTDTGLTAATTYSWTVRAVDSAGVEGATSAAASGTTLAGSGGTVTCTTSSNYSHTIAGRAYALYGITYAYGSNQNMGLWNIYITKTLKQTSPGYYVIGTCP